MFSPQEHKKNSGWGDFGGPGCAFTQKHNPGPKTHKQAQTVEKEGRDDAHALVAGAVAGQVQAQALHLCRHCRRLVLAGHPRIRHRRLHRRAEGADVDLPSVHPVLRLEAAKHLEHALVAGAVATREVQLQALLFCHQRCQCRLLCLCSFCDCPGVHLSRLRGCRRLW